MSWFLRFLAWATLLTPLCWLAALHYQRAQGEVVTVVLQLVGFPIRVTGLGIATPYELGLFTALCLSSARARWRERIRALALGLVLLMAAEVLILATAIGLEVHAASHPAVAAPFRLVATHLRNTVVWAAALVTWLAFLGARELPLGQGWTVRRPRPQAT